MNARANVRAATRVASVTVIRAPAAKEGGTTTGVAVLLGAWTMMFAGLLRAVSFARATSTWPSLPIGLPVVSAIALVAACVSISYAVHALGRARVFAFDLALALAFVLGVVFLQTTFLVVVDARQSGLLKGASTFAAAMHGLVGFHALHALGGVLVLGWLVRRANDKRLTPVHRPLVRGVALYFWMLALVEVGVVAVLFG